MTGQRADIALEIRGVSLAYPARQRQPTRQALRSIDLEIHPGVSVAMLGPNGSGKSTLIRIIAQSMPPDAGSVTCFGSADAQQIRRAIGVVFQSPSLDGHMTVRENLQDHAQFFGCSRSEAASLVAASLAEAELSDRAGSLVKSLSGGLKRRVDLCRAMLHRPRLLLLDEPTVGLDPAAREQFLRTLEQWRAREGLTILMTTHLVDEADRCDRVVLMHDGCIVADDSPQNLRTRLGRRRITLDNREMAEASGALTWAAIGGKWSAPLPDDAESAQRLTAELLGRGASFSIAPPTLADVFENLTGRGLVEDAA